MYRLQSYELSYKEAFRSIVFSEYACRHIRQAKMRPQGRIYHSIMGGVGLIPIVGAIMAIFERAIFELTKNSQKQPQYDDHVVAILWYPHSRDACFSGHTQLLVDGRAHAHIKGEYRSRDYQKTLENVILKDKVFYCFRINVTPEEFKKLNESLPADKNDKSKLIKNSDAKLTAYQSCTAFACDALKENTDFRIPLLFSRLPTLCAAYLKVKSMLGSSRIHSIERFGSGKFRLAMVKNLVLETVVSPVVLPILLAKPDFLNECFLN